MLAPFSDRFVQPIDTDLSGYLLTKPSSASLSDDKSLLKYQHCLSATLFCQDVSPVNARLSVRRPPVVTTTTINTSLVELGKVPEKPVFFGKPSIVWDAPQIAPDFYRNTLVWDINNTIYIALPSGIFSKEAKPKSKLFVHGQAETTDDEYFSLSVSRDADLLTIGRSNGLLEIRDIEKEDIVFITECQTGIYRTAWSPHSPVFLAGGDAELLFCDHRRKSLFPLHIPHAGKIPGIEWRSDGQAFASGGNDNEVFVWDMVANRISARLSNHTAAVKALAWCPIDPNLLATGAGRADKHLRVWNVVTGKLVAETYVGAAISAVHWISNSKQLICTRDLPYFDLVVYDYPSMRLAGTYEKRIQRILHAALSPDKTQIAAASEDESLSFFDLPAYTKKYKKKRKHTLIMPELR